LESVSTLLIIDNNIDKAFDSHKQLQLCIAIIITWYAMKVSYN